MHIGNLYGTSCGHSCLWDISTLPGIGCCLSVPFLCLQWCQLKNADNSLVVFGG
jgi:hypothetical protein